MVGTSRIGPASAEKMRAAWPDICDRVARGEQVGDSLAVHGFSRSMGAAFMAQDPEAMRQFDLAREASADAFFDKAQAIADTADGDPKVARVRLQAVQWLAAKRNPRRYGERSTVDLNVRHVDLTAIIRDANARLAAARVVPGQVLDSKAVPSVEQSALSGVMAPALAQLID